MFALTALGAPSDSRRAAARDLSAKKPFKFLPCTRALARIALRRYSLAQSVMNEHSFMGAATTRRPVLAERADKADKRDAILRAAIETFAARGFFNAQVADVARSAGVAAGTVYLYFRGKDDLLISIFERTMTDAIAAGRESVAAKRGAVERLREIARLHFERLAFPETVDLVIVQATSELVATVTREPSREIKKLGL